MFTELLDMLRALMAYYVDTKREANQYDGDLAREMDYISYYF